MVCIEKSIIISVIRTLCHGWKKKTKPKDAHRQCIKKEQKQLKGHNKWIHKKLVDR